MGAWVIGHNMFGRSRSTLSEFDTPAYATWNEAADALANDMREYADSNDEANDAMAEEDWTDEDYGSMRATVDAILHDFSIERSHNIWYGKDWSCWVADSGDSRVVFWLHWSDDRESDEDE
jgi:serine/threonine protein phosphatase PrpC